MIKKYGKYWGENQRIVGNSIQKYWEKNMVKYKFYAKL